MKRCVAGLLAACVGPVALAQVANGPAPPPTMQGPQMVQVESNGKCADARPGDTVNFTLTIEAIDGGRAVYGDLQLRQGRGSNANEGSLPAPDFRHLGGGGLGVRDAQTSNVFHFSFKVPVGIYSGQYRGVGVIVTADRPVSGGDAPRDVDVTRRARDEVKAYCLNIMSGFGEDGRPIVTKFNPGPVERVVPKQP